MIKNSGNSPLSSMTTLIKRTSQATAAGLAWLAYVPFAAAGLATGDVFGSVPDIGGATDPRTAILRILKSVLNFLALIAVVVIVIAGIRLVISSGDEGAVDKAKKTILYAIVGLIIILLASAIVEFVVSLAT